MTASTVHTSLAVRFPTLTSKLAQARSGGLALDAHDKASVADEFGRATRAQCMALWEGACAPDRAGLIFLVSASCPAEVAAEVVRDWLMADALRVAREQVESELLKRIGEASRYREAAEREYEDARDQRLLAAAERREAMALLAEARALRDDAAAQAELAALRAELRDAHARLSAVKTALA